MIYMSKKIRKARRARKSPSVIGFTERVTVLGPKKSKQLIARVDTGAAKNSIDVKLAAELKLGPIIKTKKVRSAEGLSERPLIKAGLKIGKRKFNTLFNLADRSRLKYKVLIGRNILKQNFIIKVNKK